MNTVEPIRSKEQIDLIRRLEPDKRNRLLFVLGINVGLRISDLINLRVRDLRDKERIAKREQKTGKETSILLNPAVRRELRELLAGRDDGEYVFQSRCKDRHTLQPKHMTRQRAYQIINVMCRRAGVTCKVGNHTLRKTFGYWHYQQFHDVLFLQKHFNHSEQHVTQRYIGIEQDELDDHMRRFRL
jgi:integrase